jgi:hypothetical protein
VAWWCLFFPNGIFREIMISNHFKITSLPVLTLVERPEQQTTTLAKRPEL